MNYRVKIAAIVFVAIGTAVVAITIVPHPRLALCGSAVAAVGLMIHAVAEDRRSPW